MTDPTGLSFLSYSRKDLEQARLIIGAQRERGIPTWQDVENLRDEPSEEEITRVLEDPLTANAVLWATANVESSTFIREVEIPRIMRRARKSDAFFLVACAASGVSYKELGEITSSSESVENIGRWNALKFSAVAPEPADAIAVANRVLARRLEEIHKTLPKEEPLSIGLFTRCEPALQTGLALTIDWSHRFDGRNATIDDWLSHLVPASRDIAAAIRKHAAGRPIAFEGLCSLPAAFALGAAFSEPAGFTTEWRQHLGSNKHVSWTLMADPADHKFEIGTCSGHLDSEDLGVFVSVAADVEKAVAQSGPPRFRAIVRVDCSEDLPHRFSTPGEVTKLAREITAAIRQARQAHHGVKRIHLFIAGPVGLAFMLGQLANTLGDVHLYEHQQSDATGTYLLAACVGC